MNRASAKGVLHNNKNASFRVWGHSASALKNNQCRGEGGGRVSTQESEHTLTVQSTGM